MAECTAVLGSVRLDTWTALFSALSEPTRLRIITLLAKGPRSVEEITVALGMLQPAVSHQLAILRMRNLVVARYEGKHRYYRLAPCICVDEEGLLQITIPGAGVQMRAEMAAGAQGEDGHPREASHATADTN